MINQTLTKPENEEPVQLCSRCISHELNSWMNDKWRELDDETRKQIAEELKSIKLKPGACIVCNHGSIADRTSENVAAILKENKTQEKTRKEFEKLFCGIE